MKIIFSVLGRLINDWYLIKGLTSCAQITSHPSYRTKFDKSSNDEYWQQKGLVAQSGAQSFVFVRRPIARRLVGQRRLTHRTYRAKEYLSHSFDERLDRRCDAGSRGATGRHDHFLPSSNICATQVGNQQNVEGRHIYPAPTELRNDFARSALPHQTIRRLCLTNA